MAANITHRNLPQLLLKAREALLCHFRVILTHYGLTEQQWRILRTLHEQGEMEPNQLCQACQILSPSMVGVLGRLQTMGLITRERATYDHRRIIISQTPDSRALVAKIAPLVEAQYRLIEETIGQDIINQTYAQIDQLLGTPLDQVPSVKLP
ncbi:homoprotocatechuate degradation operon regulator HpaR [Castellaniella sp.]|uniref:homoprotocatechuate degradation operon regulator HpaR n=1 Tax=Castellaniella sp. TaxID=1955812 RepID=UPI002AFEC627|nr:homoprotocatechuate degradation operon regulator HpaR [Castellaniella sp.]